MSKHMRCQGSILGQPVQDLTHSSIFLALEQSCLEKKQPHMLHTTLQSNANAKASELQKHLSGDE